MSKKVNRTQLSNNSYLYINNYCNCYPERATEATLGHSIWLNITTLYKCLN